MGRFGSAKKTSTEVTAEITGYRDGDLDWKGLSKNIKKDPKGKAILRSDRLERHVSPAGIERLKRLKAYGPSPRKNYITPVNHLGRVGDAYFMGGCADKIVDTGEDNIYGGPHRSQIPLAEVSSYGVDTVGNCAHSSELEVPLFQDRHSDHQGMAQSLIGWRYWLTAAFWFQLLDTVKNKLGYYRTRFLYFFLGGLALSKYGLALDGLPWFTLQTYIQPVLWSYRKFRMLLKRYGLRTTLRYYQRRTFGQAPLREVGWRGMHDYFLERENAYLACQIGPQAKLFGNTLQECIEAAKAEGRDVDAVVRGWVQRWGNIGGNPHHALNTDPWEVAPSFRSGTDWPKDVGVSLTPSQEKALIELPNNELNRLADEFAARRDGFGNSERRVVEAIVDEVKGPVESEEKP